ncbi:hypothetical protein HNR46_002323 [Haloferula luteola]|uniref:SGNH/GDSL hydrolase family protein n=1 Tax=Haloferula luteola TaxID=595692 RepID=A0A840V264_9BACT|nr:hypothetical protein [Haloferula luteola]
MTRSILSAALWATLAPTCPAAEQIVTLGDSLTFDYEAEFGFSITIFNPSTFQFETYGDGFSSTVKNWIEILGDANYRKDHFDNGSRKTYTVPLSGQTLLFRHAYNWAIPGATAEQIRDFVLGSRTFTEILADDSSSDFSLGDALTLAGIDDSDFAVSDLREQIQTVADRLTYFVGGNDLRRVYGGVYNDTLSTAEIETFVSGFVADSTEVIDQVLEWNPDLPIVIVAAPHIGITPEIRGKYPNDSVKTARITTMLEDLNGRMKALAETRGIGFADIFHPTLRYLDAATPLTIHGIPIANAGTTTGDLNDLWLNGEFSANFHPNTSAQAVIANLILQAFNRTYGSEIPPLTATEMLGGLLQQTSGQIDMSFASWMGGFGIAGAAEDDDSDGDGIPAAVEFGLGLDPTYPDADEITTQWGDSSFTLRYPLRLPDTLQVTVDPANSDDLRTFAPVTPRPTVGASGYATATTTGSQGFLRLEATLAP